MSSQNSKIPIQVQTGSVTRVGLRDLQDWDAYDQKHRYLIVSKKAYEEHRINFCFRIDFVERCKDNGPTQLDFAARVNRVSHIKDKHGGRFEERFGKARTFNRTSSLDDELIRSPRVDLEDL
jgi:hypothetical protein